MTFAYIREHYGVPAKRGARIMFAGRSAQVTYCTHYVWVRFDGGKRRYEAPIHPTDTDLVWLEATSPEVGS